MRKVYRFEDNRAYWDRRWVEAGRDRDHFDDLTIYPIRYAEEVMTQPRARTLEIGCGLGRVLKHYHHAGFQIAGIERSSAAVERLQSEDPSLDVCNGDVLDLPYEDAAFDVIMAFGVYHNLEQGLERALAETARCLRPRGRFCISMRPDNWEMRLNEVYWRRRAGAASKGPPQFHKLLVGEREFAGILRDTGLETERIHRARNVSLLYRVPLLRSAEVGGESEEARRARGYRLNAFGRGLDCVLRALFRYQTANVLVYIGHKASAW